MWPNPNHVVKQNRVRQLLAIWSFLKFFSLLPDWVREYIFLLPVMRISLDNEAQSIRAALSAKSRNYYKFFGQCKKLGIS